MTKSKDQSTHVITQIPEGAPTQKSETKKTKKVKVMSQKKFFRGGRAKMEIAKG
jgi:hypothetical protein